MSDTQTNPRYPAEAGERLVKLETIVEETRRTLERLDAGQTAIRSEMVALRSDVAAELRDVRGAARAQFCWTLAGMAGLELQGATVGRLRLGH